MKESKVSQHLISYLKSSKKQVCVSKSIFKGFETDVLGVLPDSFSIEYEIKTQCTSVIAELKKQSKGVLKHSLKRCNYFYFVLPYTTDLTAIKFLNKRVPDRYGIIFYKMNRLQMTFSEFRSAKIIHTKKLTGNCYYQILRLCVGYQHYAIQKVNYHKQIQSSLRDSEYHWLSECVRKDNIIKELKSKLTKSKS